MSRCSVMSATLRGVEARPVRVEVSVASGLPGMVIVGMPDLAVQEARERVRAAIKASGFAMPQERIVVNLAPADMKKTGSGFDLPIALGILAATHQIDPRHIDGKLVVGELSLRGSVQQTVGVMSFGVCAAREGLALLSSSRCERVPVPELVQYGIGSLGELSLPDERGGEYDVGSFMEMTYQEGPFEASCLLKDFGDIGGHEVAKRALQIAAAGNHGVLMMGPPGSGKTMLASRLPGILPPLERSEAIEAAVVHSAVGLPVADILKGMRPFRTPHHSASMAGLVGGGNPIRPGEISLAHKGILFLDELGEFKPSTLQGIRQPMETGQIVLTRADGNVEMPADFMLIAATNPCPCGYYGDENHTCTCTVPQIRQYQNRIGGPLLDRIDIHIDVRRIPPEQVVRGAEGINSNELRAGVLVAREYASWRKAGEQNACNALDKPKQIVETCGLDAKSSKFLEDMARAYNLSGRSIVRALNVARTIADLAESRWVSVEHIAEALGYRIRVGAGG